MSAAVEAIEITDPGCIWSWSSVAKLERLRAAYGGHLQWRRVFGVPGPRPGGPEEQHANWLEVVAVTGARVAERLEYVSASSLPESLAARAAERQGAERAEAVLLRLREATFLHGRPADTTERVREAVADIGDLDVERLIRDMSEPDVVASVQDDRAETRRPPLELIAGGVARADGDDVRYPFPTLIVRGPWGERILAGWTDYDAYVAAIEAVAPAPAEAVAG
jgi:predicted DsbA family dithiol-disulfide isomerase